MKEMSVNPNKINEIDHEEFNYWLSKFKGGFDKTIISYDTYSKSELKNPIGNHSFSIDKNISSRVLKMANGSNFKLSIILISVLKILIRKLVNHEEIIIGTPILKQESEKEYINGILLLQQIVDFNMSFKNLLFEVMDDFKSSEKNQNVSMDLIIQHLNLKQGTNEGNPFTDIYFILDELQERNEKVEQEFNLVFDFKISDHTVAGEIRYNKAYYSADTIKQFEIFYSNILKSSVESVDKKINDINISSVDLANQFYEKLNNTDKPKGISTIIDRFNKIVEKYPNKVALKDSSYSITFFELNKNANNVANLVIGQNIKKGEIIGVVMDRSIDFVISVLGILKAGCIFMPIDPNYPVNRINYMLKDSNCSGIVTISSNIELIADLDIPIFDLSNTDLQNKSGDVNNSSLKEPAYIIYTSGSTGKPKGVVISNMGFSNYISWAEETYCADGRSNFPLFTSTSFDLTITSIFLPLISGNMIYVYPGRDVGENLSKIINNNELDIVKLTPSHLKILLHLDMFNSSVSKLILGGEQLSLQLAKQINEKFNDRIDIYNEYGPTETTVGSIFYLFDNAEDTGNKVAIGKPINNTKIFIKDHNDELCIGKMQGEIHISGDGLALGYLNKVEETHESFYNNNNGNRFYKTGDLATSIEDNLYYLDRIDRQIKIRGNRVELGEIENVISEIFNIRDVKVLNKEINNNNVLIAYIISNSIIHEGEFRNQLKMKLPDFSIPSHFITLNEFPLTKNGKLDISKLPIPDIDTKDVIEPRNEKERKMCEVWSTILEIDQVGLNDSFIQLGGDSIKGIQLIAKLKKENIHLTFSDLMKYQTIADICEFSEFNQNSNDEVANENRLAPIQKWFFRSDDIDKNNYTQHFIIESRKRLDTQVIKDTLDYLVENHAMLKAVFNISKQEFSVEDNPDKIRYDFFEEKILEENLSVKLNKRINELNLTFDIENGRLLKVLLIKTEERDYLLFLVHHLIIDTISWQILITDFIEFYSNDEQQNSNLEFKKSDSYQSWIKYQYKQSQEFDILKSLDYWDRICSLTRNKAVKIISTGERNIKKSQSDFDIITKDKFENGNKIFNINIQDHLLAALYKSLSKMLGKSEISVSMEHNGRITENSNLDLSRTIGWFTAQYPVFIDITESDYGMILKNIKELIRQIPNNGMSYGILKYLTQDSKKNKVDLEYNMDVCFNYLGEINQQDIINKDFLISNVNNELENYNNIAYPDVLEINARIESNILKKTFTFNSGYYSESDINKLSGLFKEEILNIIEYCSNKESVEYTPSDYSDSDLSMEDLNEIQNLFN